MQDVDDLAARGHGAARGKDHGEDGREQDERQHQKAGDHDGAGHDVELLAPGGMGVETGAGNGGDRLGQHREVERARLGDLDHDQFAEAAAW